jgi:hypothetical protein
MYAYLFDRGQGSGVSDQWSGVRGQGSVIREQGTDSGIQNSGLIPLLLEGVAEGRGSDANIIQNSEFKIQNSNNLSSKTCHLSPETCNLIPETSNYACGIISFQRLYQKQPHELYPTFQGSGVRDQGSDSGIQNSKFKIQNSCESETVTCHLKPDTCNLKPETYNHLITPEILQLFEDHLINLLRDIINPKLPFSQTDDVNHCRYCDYFAICKRHNTQDT